MLFRSPAKTGKIRSSNYTSQATHASHATMSSGQVLKADKDFTKDVDKLLPEAEKLGTVWRPLLVMPVQLTMW